MECIITPSKGQSLHTKFNITCTVDNSLLSLRSTYEFGCKLQNGQYVILYNGEKNSLQTELISRVDFVEAIIRDVNDTITWKKKLNVSVRVYPFSKNNTWLLFQPYVLLAPSLELVYIKATI